MPFYLKPLFKTLMCNRENTHEIDLKAMLEYRDATERIRLAPSLFD